MKKIIYIILTLCFVSINFAQEASILCSSSKIHQFNSLKKVSKILYPSDTNFDVTYYKLDIAVSFLPRNITGAVTVNAKIQSNNVSSVFLDLTSPLTVDSVKLNGNLTSFSHPGDSLFINLNSNYNIGDFISLVVYYHGIPGSSGFGSFEYGTHNGELVAYTLSEPYGAKDWWPCKDTPADKADSADIWITAPMGMIPVSNGKLIAQVDNGNETLTYKWKVSYPIAQYLISLAITDYKLYVNYYKYSETDSMPITNYVYREYWNDNTKMYLDQTPEMIKVFSKMYGQYPFIKEKYGHAQFGWGGGMEHQTITSVGGYSSDLIAHELAHQWYGDAITCKDWHNIWLNEGFATYSQGVWIESQQGKTGYKNFISNEMYLAKIASGSIWVQDISDINQIFDSYRSYAKGGIVLHMLRGIVGDSSFYNIMRSYSADTDVAYGVATTEDFQGVAEFVSGTSLNYFFQEWIYGENYPKYSVSWDKSYLNGNLWNLSINIDQQINTIPAFFTMPVQIKINFNNGDTLVAVFNDRQSQSFNITLKGEPISISFDPDNLILKDLIITDADDKKSELPENFALEQNYPNPFNPVTKIKWQSPISGWQTLKVFDMIGNEIATLVNEYKTAGKYEVDFDGNKLASGVYLYKLITGNFVSTKKMILIK